MEGAAKPIHDWTTVVAGIFYDFHGECIRTIEHALNAGILPPDYYALAEQRAAGVEPDVVALSGGRPAAVGSPRHNPHRVIFRHNRHIRHS